MQALDLARALHAKRAGMVGWQVFVADVEDVEDLDADGGEMDVYRVMRVEMHPNGEEVNLIIEYPGSASEEEESLSAEEFVDRLEPLASDNPEAPVEASVSVDLQLGGDQWKSWHMPVRTMMGSDGAHVLILGVEGLKDIRDGWGSEGDDGEE